MMFSTETNLLEVAKTQYNYKLKSFRRMFLAMIILQVIALFFSLGGVGSSGTSSGGVELSTKNYSSEIIIIFTFFWAFVVAVMLTTREYRNIDFAFVSNRLSSDLSNIGFLVTAGLAGGLTTILGGVLLRVIVYFSRGSANILSENFFVAPGELLVGFTVTVLYLLLLSAIGYFCGILVQLNKAFLVILPALLFGTQIVAVRGNQLQMLRRAIDFIVSESFLPLLALKVLLMASLLFGSALLLSNRLEVRR